MEKTLKLCFEQALHNVFRTTEQDPEYVLEVLRNTIEDKCIPFKQSEYVSHGVLYEFTSVKDTMQAAGTPQASN